MNIHAAQARARAVQARRSNNTAESHSTPPTPEFTRPANAPPPYSPEPLPPSYGQSVDIRTRIAGAVSQGLQSMKFFVVSTFGPPASSEPPAYRGP